MYSTIVHSIYICSICGKHFDSPDLVQMHSITHSVHMKNISKVVMLPMQKFKVVSSVQTQTSDLSIDNDSSKVTVKTGKEPSNIEFVQNSVDVNFLPEISNTKAPDIENVFSDTSEPTVEENHSDTSAPTVEENHSDTSAPTVEENHSDTSAPTVENHAPLKSTNKTYVRKTKVCPFCKVSLTYSSKFYQHIRRHIGIANFVCNVCHRGFVQRQRFVYHMHHTHNIDAKAIKSRLYLLCEMCFDYFDSLLELEQHHFFYHNTQQFECDVCGVKFNMKSSLLNHKHEEHELKSVVYKSGDHFFCSICYLGFTSIDNLEKHRKTHESASSENHICDVCDVNFSNDDELQLHYLEHVDEHYSLLDVVKMNSCGVCHQVFLTEIELNTHCCNQSCNSESNNAVLSTEDSVFSVNTKSEIKVLNADCMHNNNNDLSPLVFKSNAESINNDALQGGNNISHAILDYVTISEISNNVCENTSSFVTVTTNDAEKISDVTNVCKSSENIHSNMKQNSLFESNICCRRDKRVISEKANFTEKNEMITILLPDAKADDHSKIHTCHICKESFNSKNELYVHAKEIHTGFYCKVCGESFVNKELQLVHERNFHKKKYICDLCPKTFTYNASLRAHKRIHTGDMYQCDICCERFRTKTSLNYHLMVHEGKTPPTKCSICGKIYSSSFLLNRHLMLHSGKLDLLKTFKCSICDLGFCNNYLMKKHCAVHFKSSRQNEQCKICKMYFLKSTIRRHVRSHSEIP